MRQLLFGTFNVKKYVEVSDIIRNSGLLVITLSCLDFPALTEADENGLTIAENAIIKAKYYFEQTGLPCFSDDTGLEVRALNGEPGVYSARYAGAAASDRDNLDKLLHKLTDKPDKTAAFKTVIAFVNENGELFTFEGILSGEIVETPRGNYGFGYDPIFLPKDSTRTLAEYTLNEKNLISHRKMAMNKFLEFSLENYN